MEVIAIIGYITAVIIGITLGLIGGGGSILTVPVLVYLMGVNPVLATSYSLFIVGISSLFGVFAFTRRKLVDFRTAVVFGIPSIIAVYATRKFLIPSLPEVLIEFDGFVVTKGLAIMVLFAILMVGAAFSMIRKKKQKEEKATVRQSFNYPMILLEGLIVGTLTGLVGAGGGFLIIPALVIFSKLPMKMAVGTSLLIISAKSLIGFTGDFSSLPIDWMFLGTFSVAAIFGIFIGQHLSKYIKGEKLKPAFGWFVLIMGTFILVKELVLG